jgi:hypothetical protein
LFARSIRLKQSRQPSCLYGASDATHTHKKVHFS